MAQSGLKRHRVARRSLKDSRDHGEAGNYLEGSQKSLAILITCHSHNYWPELFQFWHEYEYEVNAFPKICRFRSTKSVQSCNSFLARGESRNTLILIWEQTVVTISSFSRRVWHSITYMIYPVAPLFRSMWTFSRPLAQFPTLIKSVTTDQHRSQTPEDHRCRKKIRYFQVP